MAEEKTYYQHNKTGSIILVVDIFDHSSAGTKWTNINMCHVLSNGRWKYVKESVVDKNYTKIDWKQSHT